MSQLTTPSMPRDIDLEFSVHFSPEQVELAWQAVHSPVDHGLLILEDGGAIDLAATFRRVQAVSAHIYVSLLLVQAKREQRGILNCSVELARERRKVLVAMHVLGGKLPSAADIVCDVAERIGLNPEDLGPLQDPIRRDLMRLQS